MPGFDGSGPFGTGPMTGGRRGFCRTTSAEIGAPSAGRFGYGRGLAPIYGFRGGYGPGRGFRRGQRRGSGRHSPVYGAMASGDPASEIDMLKAEADVMKNALETINRRIAALEKS